MSNTSLLTIQSMLSKTSKDIIKGKTFVGIDFGTSTTVVSIASYDALNDKINVEPIRLQQILSNGAQYQSEKLPSVIAWYNKRILVGEGASELKYTLKKGKNIWYSFKMEIGEDLGAKYFESEVANVEPLKISNPKDCVRVLFMYLKMLITRYCESRGLSLNISYAISIPASFEANQRKELMEALGKNDMIVSRQSLIDEPNAAFISYVNDSQNSEKPLIISPHYNPKVLVFDFGGGTCDISILEIGKSAKGLYSKNLSISKFTKLGGDDIDRYITYKYLLPRFLEHNNTTIDEFRTPEIKYIASQLYKVAERLKIQISKELAVMTYQFNMPTTKDSDYKTSLSADIEVDTGKIILKQEDFYLTNKELSDTMRVFLRNSRLATSIKGQDDYNNIFMPINSAIKKANISISELDYVLLIGGSAQNPFIQEALHKYFENSEILIPQNLQTHVSKGAAIHSLLMNGMNKCIIQPITSEPIIVITKDLYNKVLIPAGTPIPSEIAIVDDLEPAKENQDTIELPICVGNKNKMLFNLKITNHGLAFPLGTPVKLALELTADKLLVAQAECMGINCMVEPCNPFANKELTTEERIVLVAERQANLEASKNGGTPTKQSLINLRQAYIKAGNDYRAAETFEQQIELYPSTNNYNEIGVLYFNAGCKKKAIEYFERSLNNNPNEIHSMFNLGHTLIYSEPERAEQYLREAHKLDPNHCPSMICLAKIEKEKGNETTSRELYQQAYDKLRTKWKTDNLRDFEYGWLASAAESLGLSSEANEIRRSKPQISQESYYNEDNLTKTKSAQLTKS